MLPAIAVLLRTVLARAGTRLLGSALAKQGTKVAANRALSKESTAALIRRAERTAPKAQRVRAIQQDTRLDKLMGWFRLLRNQRAPVSQPARVPTAQLPKPIPATPKKPPRWSQSVPPEAKPKVRPGSSELTAEHRPQKSASLARQADKARKPSQSIGKTQPLPIRPVSKAPRVPGKAPDKPSSKFKLSSGQVYTVRPLGKTSAERTPQPVAKGSSARVFKIAPKPDAQAPLQRLIGELGPLPTSPKALKDHLKPLEPLGYNMKELLAAAKGMQKGEAPAIPKGAGSGRANITPPSTSLSKPVSVTLPAPPKPQGAGSGQPTPSAPTQERAPRPPATPSTIINPAAAPPSPQPAQAQSAQAPSSPQPPRSWQQQTPQAPASPRLPSESFGSRLKGLFEREPKEPRQGLGQAARNVFNYLTGNQQSAPSSPASPPPTGQSFSSLASNKNNFADLLSGAKSPQQVTDAADLANHQQSQQQQQQDDKERSEQAKKEATESLKKIGKAAAVGGVALLTIPPAMKKFSESMLASQEYLRKFNGQIAVAFAKLQQGDIRRAQASGAATAGTTTALAEAINDMRNELRPAG
ncbi:MAG: hypothetical protein KGL39_43535, partial [Patescibacteria group bacterium]|nr:hypothetical protein [Patescibacteria group bacterium]